MDEKLKRRNDDSLVLVAIDMIQTLHKNFDSKLGHIENDISDIKETQVGIKTNQDHFRDRLDKYEKRPFFMLKVVSIICGIGGICYGLYNSIVKG